MSVFRTPYNLIIAGVGGQGNVLISQLIARAFIKKGYQAIVGETYGVSQRGGSVMSHVRLTKTGEIAPIIPPGKGDFVLGLEPMETLRILKTFGNPDIHAMTNVRPIAPLDVIIGTLPYPSLDGIIKSIQTLSSQAWTLDASAIALEMGNSLLTNMVMVGAMIGTEILPLTMNGFIDILRTHTNKKNLEDNVQALQKGREAVKSKT